MKLRKAEQYLFQTLIERRDKIVNYYLAQINPIDGFEVRHRRRSYLSNWRSSLSLDHIDAPVDNDVIKRKTLALYERMAFQE